MGATGMTATAPGWLRGSGTLLAALAALAPGAALNAQDDPPALRALRSQVLDRTVDDPQGNASQDVGADDAAVESPQTGAAQGASADASADPTASVDEPVVPAAASPVPAPPPVEAGAASAVAGTAAVDSGAAAADSGTAPAGTGQAAVAPDAVAPPALVLPVLDPPAIALPKLPAPDIHVTESRLLSVVSGESGGSTVTTGTAIPYIVGRSCYSWSLMFDPVDGDLVLTEELTLPGPARNWDSAGNGTEVNPQGSAAVTARHFDAGTGMATAGWCVAKDDPVGAYRFVLHQGDREVARFDFTVGDLL